MKRLCTVLFCLLLGVSAFSQVALDPNDPIYGDLDRWAVQGYISALPTLRPYPLQLLDELLTTVVKRGDAASREKAQSYLSAIAPGSRAMHLGLTGTIRSVDGDQSLEGSPTADGTIRPEDWLSLGYRVAVWGATRAPGKEILVPGARSPYPDLIEDDAKVGPFFVLQDWASIMALGSSSLYVQAGVNRSSFGPFFDNSVVVGPQAGKAGAFNVTYRNDRWSYSGSYLLLNATDDFGDISKDAYPGKQLSVHSLDVRITDRLELGYFESVIWGPMVRPIYLVPFSGYFTSQALSGFADNVFMGFHFRWSPFDDFQALGQVYVDDFSFKDTIRLNFDTKYKFASELGLRWSPKRGVLSDLAVDYTAVMPYMYTHINDDRERRYTVGAPNYLSYTNQGRSLGADLEPNSDRLSLRAAFRLIPNLDLSLRAGLQRHGNASDQDTTDPTALNDGSINDDGYTMKGGSAKSSFNSETRFLTQDVIETKASVGAGVAYTLPTAFGSFTASTDYVFEYAWNRGLVEGKDGASHYYLLGGTWRW